MKFNLKLKSQAKRIDKEIKIFSEYSNTVSSLKLPLIKAYS